MTDTNNTNTPKPLPNGAMPASRDFVITFECMSPTGVHPGAICIRAADGSAECYGFDVNDEAAWGAIAKDSPAQAIVKLVKGHHMHEQRMAHARREIMNANEALTRAMNVLAGRAPPTVV